LDQPLTTSRATLLNRRLESGEFVFTAEITPPLSASADDLMAKVGLLQGVVDAVNVTDGANARVHMSSVAAAATLAANGIEPIVQFTCRDRNRIALISDLLGASALGVDNLLILGGDDPSKGDQPAAKAVFDLHSSELIALAHDMTSQGAILSSQPNADGELVMTAKALQTPAQFFIGAADLPSAERNEGWLKGLRSKIAAGAKFVQTQLCYDMDLVARYVDILRDEGLSDDFYLLIGNGPLASARSAIWMRDNLFGVAMPDAVINRLDQAADAKAEGVRICAEQIEAMIALPGISGVHLMAPINTAAIPVVVAQFRG
jgi:methylenetetrahydrofolate reductase (NADPH)